jgi:DNA-binding transcriptional MerR regulator
MPKAKTDERSVLSKPRLRIDEVARLLDVTPRTVRNYLTDAKLTTIRLPSGQRRVVNDETLRSYL